MTGRFVKQANAIMAGYSWLTGTLTGKESVSWMPLSVSAELTNYCNLNCPECTSGSGLMKREKGFMDIGLYTKIISEMRPFLYSINLYFQGEPMLHPRFFSFPGLSDNIYTVVSTNGHFLSAESVAKLIKSDLKKLIVSLDGMDQETYSKYRKNGEFNKVAQGIKNVSAEIHRTGSSLKLEIQFLVNRLNEHQIKQVRHFASEIRASLKLKSMQVINSQESGKWMPANRRFRRYREVDGIFRINSSLPDRCMRLWFNPVITWDGKVIPCCFDKDAEHVMGDLNKESFLEIWNGSLFRDFREQVLSGRGKIDICRNCTSGLRGVRSS